MSDQPGWIARIMKKLPPRGSHKAMVIVATLYITGSVMGMCVGTLWTLSIIEGQIGHPVVIVLTLFSIAIGAFGYFYGKDY